MCLVIISYEEERSIPSPLTCDIVQVPENRTESLLLYMLYLSHTRFQFQLSACLLQSSLLLSQLSACPCNLLCSSHNCLHVPAIFSAPLTIVCQSPAIFSAPLTLLLSACLLQSSLLLSQLSACLLQSSLLLSQLSACLLQSSLLLSQYYCLHVPAIFSAPLTIVCMSLQSSLLLSQYYCLHVPAIFSAPLTIVCMSPAIFSAPLTIVCMSLQSSLLLSQLSACPCNLLCSSHNCLHVPAIFSAPLTIVCMSPAIFSAPLTIVCMSLQSSLLLSQLSACLLQSSLLLSQLSACPCNLLCSSHNIIVCMSLQSSLLLSQLSACPCNLLCSSHNCLHVPAIFSAPLTGTDFVLKRAVATPDTVITLLGYGNTPLDYSMASSGLHIKFPLVPYGKLLYAWTFKMTGLL